MPEPKPVTILVTSISVGDDELDTMTLLTAVMKERPGNSLSAEDKERVAQWLADRYKCVTPRPAGG